MKFSNFPIGTTKTEKTSRCPSRTESSAEDTGRRGNGLQQQIETSRNAYLGPRRGEDPLDANR